MIARGYHVYYLSSRQVSATYWRCDTRFILSLTTCYSGSIRSACSRIHDSVQQRDTEAVSMTLKPLSVEYVYTC